jgi:hypothetical protein
VQVRDKDVEIHYDVEETPEGNVGVARLRLPEKLARTLAAEELPKLDRPLRFIVTRGARGAARANTLDELQEELERPFTEKEIQDMERDFDTRRREHREKKRKDRNQRDRKPDRRRRPSETDAALKEDRRPPNEEFDGRRRRGPGGSGGGKKFRPPRKRR